MKMNKKLLIILIISCMAMLTFNAYATGIKIRVLEEATNWSEIFTSPVSENNAGSYVQASEKGNHDLTPPSSISVSITYTEIYVHIGMPGKWMFNGVQITTRVTPSMPIKLTFTTSGDLSNGNSTIPTYYQMFDGNDPNYHPHQPLWAAVWKRASEDWPTGMNGSFTVRGGGNHSFKLWTALEVGSCNPAGSYEGSVTITITPVCSRNN
jgi:hypothetical protein